MRATELRNSKASSSKVSNRKDTNSPDISNPDMAEATVPRKSSSSKHMDSRNMEVQPEVSVDINLRMACMPLRAGSPSRASSRSRLEWATWGSMALRSRLRSSKSLRSDLI